MQQLNSTATMILLGSNITVHYCRGNVQKHPEGFCSGATYSSICLFGRAISRDSSFESTVVL